MVTMPGERKASVLVDHIDHRRFQLIGADVLALIRRSTGGRDFWGMTSRLVGAEIAAVTKDRKEISLGGVGQLVPYRRAGKITKTRRMPASTGQGATWAIWKTG